MPGSVIRFWFSIPLAFGIVANVAAAQKAVSSGSAPLRKVVQAFEQKESKNQRIVGGHPTTIDKHPWQVALLAAVVPPNARAQFCGGSIVAPQWVLTAAHCVDQGTQPQQVVILAGTDSLANGGKRITVDRIIVHNNWDTTTHDFDVALVHVTEQLGGLAIKGIPANQGEPRQGQEVTITGWGSLAWRDVAGTEKLQEVSVPYVPRDTCNRNASYGGKVTQNMFCAGRDEGGADSCQGDSGGPATVVMASEAQLIGIVSWGEGCGFPKKYGVYTRVTRFNEWIQQTSGGEIHW
jgi:trypsin